ncbi:hypothetical protein SHJG_0221 [Streptomyces hygroscopicus subsp. jinggangensis 5008]|nr:hypothetical protein SHJG_0221 [Streptomyces hygroscopicus subsp. jinggangensis 5008]
MIFSQMRLQANPDGLAPLTREQIWRGLEQKARNAVPYVEAITACRVINEVSDTVFDRQVLLGGARYVERVWLVEPRIVVFTRLEGPILGTIVNEIIEEEELSLRFQFALTVGPGEDASVTEEDIAAQMTSAYQVAVETTLQAVRAQLVASDAEACR